MCTVLIQVEVKMCLEGLFNRILFPMGHVGMGVPPKIRKHIIP